jgi:hypothetical protein
MLQVLYLDVVKVDLDVAYTCMLQTYVSSVLGISYVCLQVFYLDVAYVSMVFKCFSGVFASVSDTCVSFVFFRMLQLLHLDILKVDRVLHIGCVWEVGWRRGRRPGRRGPNAGMLACELDALGARSLPVWALFGR